VITRVAVLPQPPLLVPELVGGPDEDAARLRDACVEVAARLAAAADEWIAIGAAAAPAVVEPGEVGTFADFGVNVEVSLGAANGAEPDPSMPLPALVAGWLRGAANARQVQVRLVAADMAADGCRRFGAQLAAELAGDVAVGVLVLGDGSHRHGERAVGRPDERAGGFDDAVAAALAAADPSALLDVDAELARSLGAAGRAPWQVLAGLAEASGAWRCAGSSLTVPFGVAYHLAEWEPVR
jgi:aromatic ring-opening dioxygenase LigB subunit